MKKLIVIFLLSIAGVFPVYAEDVPLKNAGFVQANIWYSKDPFYAGEKIRIYTVIFNGSSYDLKGAVEFFDNGASVGKTTFTLLGGGRVQDLWVDWKATEGAHVITARLVNVVADGPNGKKSVVLANVETGKSERTVELDPVAKVAQEKLALEAQKNSVATRTGVLVTIEDAMHTASGAIPAPIKQSVSSTASAVEQFRINEGVQLRLAKEEKIKEIDTIKEREKVVAGSSFVNDVSRQNDLRDTIPQDRRKDMGILDTASNATEKPFAYAMLAILTFFQYLFEWKIVFYGVMLYALYRLLKWIVQNVRNR